MLGTGRSTLDERYLDAWSMAAVLGPERMQRPHNCEPGRDSKLLLAACMHIQRVQLERVLVRQWSPGSQRRLTKLRGELFCITERLEKGTSILDSFRGTGEVY